MDNTKETKCLFMKRLKYLYKKVDQSSTLLWSHDNNLTQGKKLRSQNGKTELNWKTKLTQIGYGEIAMVNKALI
jgi:hypothetical protein